MKNKYIKVGKISEAKFREILKLFSEGIEATKTAKLTGINRNTINRFFSFFRERICQICAEENPLNEGEIEIDESYFGARRIRGKRGRGAGGKIPVFGMLKRGEKVYTQIVKNCSAIELLPIILEQSNPEKTVVFSDTWKSYDGLVNFGYKRHYRIKHGESEFSKKEKKEDGKIIKNHVNGIENFWGLCKVRLARYRGIHKHKFHLHLKECEFRYNYRSRNLYKILLKSFRKLPLN